MLVVNHFFETKVFCFVFSACWLHFQCAGSQHHLSQVCIWLWNMVLHTECKSCFILTWTYGCEHCLPSIWDCVFWFFFLWPLNPGPECLRTIQPKGIPLLRLLVFCFCHFTTTQTYYVSPYGILHLVQISLLKTFYNVPHIRQALSLYLKQILACHPIGPQTDLGCDPASLRL